MAHYKNWIIVAAVVFTLVAFTAFAQADPLATFELRDCFESPPLSEQSANNLWTFHSQDHNGAMFPLDYGFTRYGIFADDEIIGPVISSGDEDWIGVWSGPESIPTFDGVFVHPGKANATAVVFHAPEAMSISEIKLWSEGVGDSAKSNGISVTVNSVISGVTRQIGSFTFFFPSMVETSYTHSTIALQEGDMIEIVYGPNGDHHFDHGNVNVFISTPQTPVPLPIEIDIKPGDDTNVINARGMKTIYVAILSSTDFDAPQEVDPETLTFGPTGNEASPIGCTGNNEDINGDGSSDLLCEFSMKLEGGFPLFECGNTVGILKGKTVPPEGRPLVGQQAVVIVPCK
jgi:hypothetical protein